MICFNLLIECPVKYRQTPALICKVFSLMCEWYVLIQIPPLSPICPIPPVLSHYITTLEHIQERDSGTQEGRGGGVQGITFRALQATSHQLITLAFRAKRSIWYQ